MSARVLLSNHVPGSDTRRQADWLAALIPLRESLWDTDKVYSECLHLFLIFFSFVADVWTHKLPASLSSMIKTDPRRGHTKRYINHLRNGLYVIFVVISVKLDNACHIVLDERRTEKAGSDFSADATDMDFKGYGFPARLFTLQTIFWWFLPTNLLFVSDLLKNKLLLGIYQMELLFELILCIWTATEAKILVFFKGAKARKLFSSCCKQNISPRGEIYLNIWLNYRPLSSLRSLYKLIRKRKQMKGKNRGN